MSTQQNSTRGGSLRPSRSERSGRPGEDEREETLDQTIEDTFPASDPPSSIPDPQKPPPKPSDRGPRE